MKYTFCPQCGEKLSEIHAGDDGMVPYCESCEVPWFDTFWSCVIVLVYNEYDEVVLSRQSYLSDTYASFTSGYMTPGETAEETAIREVKEELGLDLETLIYAGTHWFGKRDMLYVKPPCANAWSCLHIESYPSKEGKALPQGV